MKQLTLTEEQRLNLAAWADIIGGDSKELARQGKIAEAAYPPKDRLDALKFRWMDEQPFWAKDAAFLTEGVPPVELEDADAELLKRKLAAHRFPDGGGRVNRRWVGAVLEQL